MSNKTDISISDLPVNSQALFIRRHEKYINTNSEDIENGLYTRIENTTDTLKILGLRYNEKCNRLESHYDIINDLSIVVGMEHDNFHGITEFDLQYENERKALDEYLSEYPYEYVITYFDSEIFNHDENTDMNDVLETYYYLSMLNTKQQELFADIFVNGYGDSPIDLVNMMIRHLKDW